MLRYGSHILAMSRRIVGLLLLFTALPLVFLIAFPAGLAGADENSKDFSEKKVRFESGDVTLSGIILVPDTAGQKPERKPAVALVHGAGPGQREEYRQEAEAFAQEGLVTLIYDKRQRGYSQFERSYELLAEDALAAVDALRARPEVDPGAVGLWGLSEGAWVVPIAASKSEEVAFVVLVAATGVPPSQQHSWYLENQLRHQGVSGSMVEAVSRTATRLLIEADLFAEAYHDPVEPLKGAGQPVLALYGQKDRIEPPAESARILRKALEQGGNEDYTIRFFPDAEHGLRSSSNGFIVGEDLVDDYPTKVASWVKEVASGQEPGPTIIGPEPRQARLSYPVAPLAWWESGWVQLGAIMLPTLSFASYLTATSVATLTRFVQRRPRGALEPIMLPVRRWARRLAGAGLTAMIGFICYLNFLIFTGASAVGPVVAGRPLPWITLQVLSVVATYSTLALAVSWLGLWSVRGVATRVRGAERRIAERAWAVVLLTSGVVFVAWATYWGLLVP